MRKQEAGALVVWRQHAAKGGGLSRCKKATLYAFAARRNYSKPDVFQHLIEITLSHIIAHSLYPDRGVYMPNFELLPVEEAKMKSATGQRAQITREYLSYIDRLTRGQAGRLQVTEGERVGAIRRRLGAAATLANKELVIKRTGDEVFFWLREDGTGGARRRGRPRKSA